MGGNFDQFVSNIGFEVINSMLGMKTFRKHFTWERKISHSVNLNKAGVILKKLEWKRVILCTLHNYRYYT